jgi:hypothetical protein
MCEIRIRGQNPNFPILDPMAAQIPDPYSDGISPRYVMFNVDNDATRDSKHVYDENGFPFGFIQPMIATTTVFTSAPRTLLRFSVP